MTADLSIIEGLAHFRFHLSRTGVSEWGWQRQDWIVALVAGLLSALTLPVGAILGCVLPPFNPGTIALIIAFGAGSLVFAVTVELYGEALEELQERHAREITMMAWLVLGAVVGACIYIAITKWIDASITSGKIDLLGPDLERREHISEPLTPLSPEGPLSPPGGPSGQASPRETSSLVSRSKRVSTYLSKDGLKDLRGRRKAVLGALEPLFMRVKRQRSRTSREQASLETTSDGSLGGNDAKNLRVAIGIYCGVMLDGIPESILLGFLAAEDKLSLVIVIALFVSNFPESFSSAMICRDIGISSWKIISMWALLFVFTGIIASLTAFLLPDDMLAKRHAPGGPIYQRKYSYLRSVGAFIEGIAGGAMLACVANVMLPDAYHKRGDMVGMVMLLGFLMAVLLKVFGGYMEMYY